MWTKDPLPGAPMPGNGVCVIVITYHPDAAFPTRLRDIACQVDALVIVDNGSADAESRMLREVAADPKVELTLNLENFGVAKALNLGIRRAAARGYPFALLLDQDTCVDADMVHTLLAIHASLPHSDRLAVIGSHFREMHRPSPDSTDPEPHGALWDKAESVITSGSLLPLAAHAEIGPFREEFFIDYVDSEYCLRAAAKGYWVIKSRKPLMSHPIGALSRHRFLWLNKWTNNHSPDRCYYIARNNTVLLREYGKYSRIGWFLKSVNRSFRMCKRVALYENAKARKIAAVVSGWRDGITGKLGPRPARRAWTARLFHFGRARPERRQGESA